MPLEKISAAYLKDAFEAGLEFCRTVLEKERELPYCVIAWNYMPPSGGGLLHPHQQIFITDEPAIYTESNVESKNYRQKWEEISGGLCRRKRKGLSAGLTKSAGSPLLSQGVLGEIMVVSRPEHHK